MTKFTIHLPPIPEGMSVEEYVDQGYGYPAYAHQDAEHRSPREVAEKCWSDCVGYYTPPS
jgi:hypothetical protein